MPIPEEMGDKVRQHARSPTWPSTTRMRWGGALVRRGLPARVRRRRLPWAHLDIAGPAFNEGEPVRPRTPGGTGVSVATLVEFARAMSAA